MMLMSNEKSDALIKDREGGINPVVVSVSSAKGGVGKTSLVVNVSYFLSQIGKKVLILDADLGLSNVDVMLGLTPKKTIKDVLHYGTSLNEILIRLTDYLHIIPASSGVHELQSLESQEKLTIKGMLEELLPFYDMVFIDNSAGIADNVIYFNLTAQVKLIIITPEITSLVDAYSLIKILALQHNIRKFYLVINQVKDLNEAKKVFKHMTAVSEKFLGPISFTFLGHIPKDDAVHKAICKQKPVIELYPKSQASKGFSEIGYNLLKFTKSHENDFSLIYNNMVQLNQA